MKLLKNKRKEEIKELKKRVEKLEERDEIFFEKMRDYYDRCKEIEIEISYIKKDYNTKIKRKQEVEKLCERLEKEIEMRI